MVSPPGIQLRSGLPVSAMWRTRARLAGVARRSRKARRSSAVTASSAAGRTGSAVGAAGQHVDQRRAHDAVMRREPAGRAPRASRRLRERRGAGRTGQRDRRRFRRGIAVRERQRLRLGVRQQAVAVHGDAVVRAQEAEAARLEGALRHPPRRDQVEGRERRRHRAVRAALPFAESAPASPCSRPSPAPGRCGSRRGRWRARHGPGSRGSAAGARSRRRARGPPRRRRPGWRRTSSP